MTCTLAQCTLSIRQMTCPFYQGNSLQGQLNSLRYKLISSLWTSVCQKYESIEFQPGRYKKTGRKVSCSLCNSNVPSHKIGSESIEIIPPFFPSKTGCCVHTIHTLIAQLLLSTCLCCQQLTIIPIIHFQSHAYSAGARGPDWKL